ncbi:MAG: PhzF family phenazine biosynthesis protein [Candidatus Limnocylindrales bacterium]
MGRRYRFRQVDVFSDRPFAGNPLAVFSVADGLSDAEMQTIAREMNLSETTFVLPPTEAGLAAGATYRVRIFTPGLELPFAGHPSIGTAWVLADERRFPLSAPSTEVQQELAIGVLPLAIEVRDGAPGAVQMTQGTPHLLQPLDPADLPALAEALEVTVDAFGWTDPDGTIHDASLVPPRVATTGLPYLVVPFRDVATLAAVRSARNAPAAAIARRHGSDSVALVAPGNVGAVPDADVPARGLVDPAVGIQEDPATGSAAGPIAVYLGTLGGAQDERRQLIIEQGVEIGRPSRLEVEVSFYSEGTARSVRLTGRTVPILEGWLDLP